MMASAGGVVFNHKHIGYWRDRARAAEAKLDAQSKPLAEREWRDIASAPKGVLIDIWTVGWGSAPMRVCDCYFDAECREWRTSRPSLHLLCIPERFVTHWMPTANPPVPTEGNEE